MTGAAAGGKRQAVILAGPTCSGKSTLALAVARALDGTIINADSMQVYRELRILTARPTEAEEGTAPHALYGVRPASEPGNAAWWRRAAIEAMQKAADAGSLPILCGGSGMYFSALIRGLADIPDPGPDARAQARETLATLGAEALHQRLAATDPATAATLRPSDGQRIARAWEVWLGTGHGLQYWRSRAVPAFSPWRFTVIRLDPPREALRAAIGQRFAAMLEGGALDEVSGLMDQKLDPALPAMRAHGVPELTVYLRGEIGLAEAKRRAILATGQYTKRQATWFRHHQMAPPDRTQVIRARMNGVEQLLDRTAAASVNFIRSHA